MKNFLIESHYFGLIISLLSYLLGTCLKKKFKNPIFNPLLVSIVLTIITLIVFKIDYSTYKNSANILSYLLTPATVCLAIPLYEKMQILKKNFAAIICGITSGVISSLSSTLLLSKLLSLDYNMYVTLLPKSITTAIGIGVSEVYGGNTTLTACVIIITGVLGSIIAPLICKLFRIVNPIAKGIALGTSSHAIGTTKALELGVTEGAMSSLSIAVSGLITVVLASVFVKLY